MSKKSELEIKAEETCLGHITNQCGNCKDDPNNKNCNLGYQPRAIRKFTVISKKRYYFNAALNYLRRFLKYAITLK